jgi:UDP-glucose 4-epimerase
MYRQSKTMSTPSAAIIGANGYIGRHMVRHLQGLGWRVYAYDVQDSLAPELEAAYGQLDITDIAQVKALDLSQDFLFYFSGLTGTDVSFEKHEQFVRVNETGLLNILQHLSGSAHKPKVVFPSTRLVYKGQQDVPLTEEAEKEFKTIYASSKYNGELYLEMYRNLYEQPYSVFRICVPYGNAFKSELSYGTISFFLGRAMKGEAISLFGDGTLKRTFTHVEDICEQIVAASLKPESNGHTYNIDGETYSLGEVAAVMGAKYGVPVSFAAWPDKALRLESGDTIFDATKIRGLPGGAHLKHSLDKWIHNK